MITAKITYTASDLSLSAGPAASQTARIAMQQWLRGDDGAKIIRVADEAEAILRSAGDDKNFYVWE